MSTAAPSRAQGAGAAGRERGAAGERDGGRRHPYGAGRHSERRHGRWHHQRARVHRHLHHHRLRGHRRTGPPLLVALAALIALAVMTPLIFLIVQAFQTGWSTLQPLLFRSLTAELVRNTISLTVVVTVLCAALGTVLAWFVERTALPGRRIWAVLVVIPLGIPDFVVSFGWKAIFNGFGGFWAAVLVMTLAVYPLVFLPVAANLRNADPAQEEVARSLGLGRLRTFWKVTVGQAKLAILGGSVLVALVCLAEFGAFEILGFRTLTTEAYTEFTVGFNTAVGCALSLILVLLGAILLLGEGAARGKGRGARVGAGAARLVRPRPLGRATVPVLAGVAGVVVLALGVPVGAIVYLLVVGGTSTVPSVSLWGATLTTFGLAAAAGLVATVGALPIALLSVRHPGPLIRLLERTSMLVLAVPAIVIGLTAAYVTTRYLDGRWYQTTPLLIVVYAVMFFPMAVVSVRAAVARAPDRARGSRPVARGHQALGVLARHPPADRSGAGRRLLSGLPRDGHRADGDAHPHPDRHEHAGDGVLGPADQLELLGGGALCGHDAPHRRRAQLRVGSLVRPAARAGLAAAGTPPAPGAVRVLPAGTIG